MAKKTQHFHNTISVTAVAANGSLGTSGQALKTDGTNVFWGDAEDTAAVWGNITGTLSDQTDLQTALNGKLTVSNNSVNWGAGALKSIIPALTFGDKATEGTVTVFPGGAYSAPLGGIQFDLISSSSGGAYLASIITANSRAEIGVYGAVSGWEFDANPYVGTNVIWHAGNDGTGSGLDADLLDGVQLSAIAQLTGAAFTGSVSVAGNFTLNHASSGGMYGQVAGVGAWALLGTSGQLGVYTDTFTVLSYAGAARLQVSSGGFTYLGNTVWHAGNDGTGSGLDADTVDGIQASAFAQLTGGTFTGGVNLLSTGGPVFTVYEADQTRLNRAIVGADAAGGYIRSTFSNGGTQDLSIRGASSTFATFGTGGTTFEGNVTAPNFATLSASTAGAGSRLGVNVPYTGDNFQIGRTGPTFATAFGWWDANRNFIYTGAQMRIGGAGGYAGIDSSGVITSNGNTVWHAGNDGTGSGLDADLLDGYQATAFARKAEDVVWTGYHTFNLTAAAMNGFDIRQAGAGAILSLVADYGVTNKTGTISIDTAGNLVIRNQTSGNHYYDSFTGNYYFRNVGDAYSTAFSIEPSSVSAGLKYLGYRVWHEANDGTGSGLDADTVDGVQASAFALLTGATFTGPTQSTQHNVTNGAGGTASITLRSGSTVTGYAEFISPTNVRQGYIGFGATGGALQLASDTGAGWNVANGPLYVGGNTVWHSGNDGAGSGLDADLLDGLNSTDFLRSGASDQSIYSANHYGRIITGKTDGLYVGYGNLNSGVTYLYGGGSTSSAAYITSSSFNITSPLNLGAFTSITGGTWGGAGSTGFYKDASGGLCLVGTGTSDDITLVNKNGASVFTVPTGTTNLNVIGNYLNLANAGFAYKQSGGLTALYAGTLFYFQNEAGNQTWLNLSQASAIFTGDLINAGGYGIGNGSSTARVENGYSPKTYGSGASPAVGAIRIKLPDRGANTMVTMAVKVFDYLQGSTTFYISFYSYSGTQFNTCEVHTDGGPHHTMNVRWGYDASNSYVYIGEVGYNWSYPKVEILDYMAGHTVSNWNKNWAISLVSAFDTISAGPVAPTNKFNTITTGYVSGTLIDASGGFRPTGSGGFNYASDVGLTKYSTGAWLNVPTSATGYLGYAGNARLGWNDSGISITGNLNTTGTTTSGGYGFFGTGYASGVHVYLGSSGSTTTSAICFRHSGGEKNLQCGSDGKLNWLGTASFNDIYADRTNGTGVIFFGNGGARYLYYDGTNYSMPGANLVVNGGTVWTSTNDGAGSGLDADMLDGLTSGYFLRSDITQYTSGYIGRNTHSAGALLGGYNNIGASEAKTNPIFAIGSSYVPADAALNSMYGIGYTVAGGGSGVPALTGSSSWGMYVASAGTVRVFLDATNGTVCSTAGHYGTDFFASSDRALKKDIDPIFNALEMVNKMRGVYFTRISDDSRNVGVIAQEMEEICPELVTGEEGTKSVNYANITAVLIEAVKELTAKVAMLEDKLQ